ncbi:unnamed protein product [Camellia sinensis]
MLLDEFYTFNGSDYQNGICDRPHRSNSDWTLPYKVLALKCGETVFCNSILHEFPVFRKSILSEYAVKMHLEKPTYNTTRSVGLLPLRVSALVFNSVTYTGEAGKNKEAEQLAARKVILSILDTSDSRTVITEIIKSIVKVNEGDSTQSGINPVAESTTGTIVFVSPAQALEQPLDVGSSSTKKRRKKAKKKSRDDAHCCGGLKSNSFLFSFKLLCNVALNEDHPLS